MNTTTTRISQHVLLLSFLSSLSPIEAFHVIRSPPSFSSGFQSQQHQHHFILQGWVQGRDGEWSWEEDDSSNNPVATILPIVASATPQLPSGSYKPKQSLGQNYLKDPNTVAKIVRAFHQDATQALTALSSNSNNNTLLSSQFDIVELGPGAGALTDKLVDTYGANRLQCIELDERSVALLTEKHPSLHVRHDDVLQIDYPSLQKQQQQQQSSDPQPDQDQQYPQPLVVIGNLPYYITSQILFCLADASHSGSVASATVTMQWEVGQRLVASTSTKDYGILSVVFQLYTRHVHQHFKIPPTVFYPPPKVDSALLGLHFWNRDELQQRLGGVQPAHLRRVVTAAFQQRRKTLKNSLKRLVQSELTANNDDTDDEVSVFWHGPAVPVPPCRLPGIESDADRALPDQWSSKRAEELTPGQFVELTRRLFGPRDDTATTNNDYELGTKVWRKLKHGSN